MAHHGVKHVRPVDYFERSLPRIWVLDGGERKVVALFNWSTNETFSVDCDFGYVGLDPEKTYVGYDFWEKRPIDPFRRRFRATVPPDDCRILSCCEVKEDEIVISTSLHVASPVYGVENGRVLTIRGEPLEVRTYSPATGHRSFLMEPGLGGWRDLPVGSLRSQTVSEGSRGRCRRTRTFLA